MKKLKETYLILSPDKINIVYDGVFETKKECNEMKQTLDFPCVVGTIEDYQKSVNASVIKPRQR